MSTSSDLPPIPKDLLDALDSKFPERCPEVSWSDREVWVRTGERLVIRYLKRVYEEQNRNILDNPVLV